MLDFENPVRMNAQNEAATNMRIGFACAWKKSDEKTWSGTPWGLRNALARQAEVVDLGVEYSATQTILKFVYARHRHGRWGSTYYWSASRDRMIERKLRAALDKTSVDGVIEVGDLARLEVPFYPYKDLSFAVLEEFYDPSGGAPGFKGIDLDTIRYRKERQHRLWMAATGIFAMSEWLAEALVQLSGVPRDKVTVVYAGLNSIEAADQDGIGLVSELRSDESVGLLFVGRDFFRKGGDMVVKALTVLRREYSPLVRLTVAGPDRWPLPGDIPEGITFLGNRTPAQVAELYRTHDLFVMPSRFEAFGIAFREALAHGMPVVGRSAFAMPEVIEPGRNGALVDSDDPEELASTIVSVLEDPTVRQTTIAAARSVREQYSWDAVAARMLRVMASPTP